MWPHTQIEKRSLFFRCTCVHACRWSPDGSFLAINYRRSTDGGNSIVPMDVFIRRTADEDGFRSMAGSPDGRVLVAAMQGRDLLYLSVDRGLTWGQIGPHCETWAAGANAIYTQGDHYTIRSLHAVVWHGPS